MQETGIMLPILYLLVAVLLTCETRFRHVGYGVKGSSGYRHSPLPTYNNRGYHSVSGNSLINRPFYHRAPFKGGKEEGHYTINRRPSKTKLLVSKKGLSESKKNNITAYSSKPDPLERFIINLSSRLAEEVENERKSVLNDQSLFVGKHANQEKVTLEPTYIVYKELQIVSPYERSMHFYHKLPFENFKPAARVQSNQKLHPYAVNFLQRPPEWSPIKQEANKESGYLGYGYLGVRFTQDDSSIQDDFSDQDESARYPTGFSMEARNRFGADYYDYLLLI